VAAALIAIASVLVVIVVFALFTMFVMVHQQRSVVVERLGRFNRILGPGLHLKIPLFERVAGKLSLRIQQLEVPVETKTNDNVIVNVSIAVQFKVPPNNVEKAFYQLDDPEKQIESYVLASVRGEVPKMQLDDLYENKDQVAGAVEAELKEAMEAFGYQIVIALVTDISPDAKVKAAMNDINAAVREREAATARGDANKVITIKAAEAEAASKQLQGEGIANERRAIAAGIKDSVAMLRDATGVDPSEALATLTLTQQMDTLREIGSQAGSTVILMPSGPGAVTDFFTQFVGMQTAVKAARVGGTGAGRPPSGGKPA
jgi:regulator of protease activity HflC (stomatin/prohibitin superfamily)